jgi:phosphoadenosine phosphosulfate reductase
VFWLHPSALEVGARIGVNIGTADARGVVTAIHHAVDPGQLAPTESRSIGRNHVGEIEIALDRPIACDPYESNPVTGRVVLEYDGRIAGGGLLLAIDSSAAIAAAPAVRSGFSNDLAELEARAGRLAVALADLSPVERMAKFRQEVHGKITFTTSFGAEDQAILHWLNSLQADIDVVTLDTGRLFPETYELWAQTERRYGLRIRAVYPHHARLEQLVARQGINGFYESKVARAACCHVRKVEPLNRALAGANAWITGLRGDQSTHRAGMGVVELDAERGLLKLNPLFDWTRQAVLDFVKDNKIPANPLHAKGFASIGCAPCTRAIAPNEPERAGRWWWEQEEKKECGLHISAAR